MSSDHRLFWEFPWHEKCSYKSFILLYFYVCLVLFPPLSILCIQYYPPLKVWEVGVTLEGWKAWDAFKDMPGFYTLVHTLICTWKYLGTWHYPWVWEGLPKREWERNIPYTTWILPKFLLCKLFLVEEAEEAVTQQWAFLEPQPQQQHAGVKWLQEPGRKDWCLHEDLCSSPAVKAEVYLQTFCELSRLGSVWNLRLLNLQRTWLSCVSKLDKWCSSVLGFNILQSVLSLCSSVILKAMQQLPCFSRCLAMYMMCMSGKSQCIYLTVSNQRGHLHYIIFHFRYLGGTRLKSAGARSWSKLQLGKGHSWFLEEGNVEFRQW